MFGVATASKDAAVPIMGIGSGNGYNLMYNNIVDELAAQGVTDSKAFSLALGSSSQNNGGVVIFGGVDTKKFVGKLHQYQNLPPQTGDDGLWRYWIQLDSVGVTRTGSSGPYPNSGLPVVLDSGSSYCYLPTAVINRIASSLGTSVADDGSVPVSCSVLSQGGTVDFTFGQLTIHVPVKDFVRQLDDDTCEVGAMPVGDTGTALLGDTFLRSAYGKHSHAFSDGILLLTHSLPVVFDQSNKEIFMAPYANCGTNENTLPSGQGAAANLTGECTANSAAPRPLGAAWFVLACVASLQLIITLL